MGRLFVRRVVAAKMTGFIIGLIGFVSIPFIFPDASLMLRFGVLLWYTIVGGMIGLVGIMDHHPIFHFKLNPWMRGIAIGGVMNLALALIAFDVLSSLMASTASFADMSPFWIILEGMIVGVIVDLVATKRAGDGPSIVTES